MKPTLCFTLAALGLLSACEPVKPTEPQPTPNDLRYETTHSMIFDKHVQEFRTSFTGTRCYSTSATGFSRDHNFTFDDNNDEMIVSVNDVDGLYPGDSFSYLLQHVDPSTSATLHTWRIQLRNPEAASKKLHYFQFRIARNNGDLTWDEKVQVGGIYKFGQTPRAMGVDIQFKVGNTVSLLKACDPND